jgi:hypothetical protein
MSNVNENDKLAALTDQPVSVTFGKKTYQLRRITLGDASAMTQFQKQMSKQEDTLEFDVDTYSLAFLFCRLMVGETVSPADFLNSVALEESGRLKDTLDLMGLKKLSQTK